MYVDFYIDYYSKAQERFAERFTKGRFGVCFVLFFNRKEGSGERSALFLVVYFS